MVTAQQWKNTGLIPTSGLAAWHMFEAGVSGSDLIGDFSGNARHLQNLINPGPVLTFNALAGQPAWVFNGTTTNPLLWSGAVTIKHAFILASHDDAAFNLNRGLLTGVRSGDVLVSEATGTKFTNLGFAAGFDYRKSDIAYLESNQQAPMSGGPELIEFSDADGAMLDGIQVGKQRNIAGRIWKGKFFEQILFTRVLDATERRRVMLYFNLKFAQWRVGLPFYFPSDDLMQFRRSRFYAAPLEYKDTTDFFEFEDRGRTFNEVADTPPRKWEYVYRRRSAEATVIFDEFWNQARLVNKFIFRDKYGTEWPDVQVEDYNRTHERHLSMFNDIVFKLVKYP